MKKLRKVLVIGIVCIVSAKSVMAGPMALEQGLFWHSVWDKICSVAITVADSAVTAAASLAGW